MTNNLAIARCTALAILLSGCACESGVGIVGNQDAGYADGPWDPAIDNLGETGWRESTEPWCSEAPTFLNSFDIWSDTTAVYVYGEFFYRDAGAACPSDDCYGRAGIHRNTGTGWSFVWEQPEDWLLDTSHSWLSGVANGPLFVLNRGLSCEFYIIDPPSQDCAMDGAETVQDVFAVNSSLVFGIKGEKVVYWDGSTWGPYPAAYTPYEVQRIWADGESVFCAGPEGTVISLEGEDWRIHDTGTLTGFADIWGFGADDVWVAGGDTGLMHFDGTSWTEVEWPSLTDPEDSCQFEEFGEFWGADGILFFHTYDQLIMWDGVAFSVLGHWPAHMVETTDGPQCVGGIEITGIWGNSPDEVFLAVRDRSHLTEGCGMENILWWDGTEFHWF